MDADIAEEKWSQHHAARRSHITSQQVPSRSAPHGNDMALPAAKKRDADIAARKRESVEGFVAEKNKRLLVGW